MRVGVLDRGSREVGSANQFINIPDLKKEGVTLSGIVLENVSKQHWQMLTSGSAERYSGDPFDAPDPKYSTADREFKRGTVLRFGVEVLNARSSDKKPAALRIQSRVFHDRKLVFISKETTLKPAADGSTQVLDHTDAIELGTNLLPGDYVLQLIVTDGNASKKKRIATQYVQFEVAP